MIHALRRGTEVEAPSALKMTSFFGRAVVGIDAARGRMECRVEIHLAPSAGMGGERHDPEDSTHTRVDEHGPPTAS